MKEIKCLIYTFILKLKPWSSNITLIKHLDLSNNQLRSIEPGTFAHLSSLQSLVLGGNQLSFFVGAFLVGIPSLRLLDLSLNRINELPVEHVAPFLSATSNLERLILSSNLISEVFFTSMFLLKMIVLCTTPRFF